MISTAGRPYEITTSFLPQIHRAFLTKVMERYNMVQQCKIVQTVDNWWNMVKLQGPSTLRLVHHCFWVWGVPSCTFPVRQTWSRMVIRETHKTHETTWNSMKQHETTNYIHLRHPPDVGHWDPCHPWLMTSSLQVVDQIDPVLAKLVPKHVANLHGSWTFKLEGCMQISSIISFQVHISIISGSIMFYQAFWGYILSSQQENALVAQLVGLRCQAKLNHQPDQSCKDLHTSCQTGAACQFTM